MALELNFSGVYCRRMKRVCLLLAMLACFGPLLGRAQDASTEERLRQLRGKIEDLLAGQEAQRKYLEQLAREVGALRKRQNTPVPDYASNEDLRRLKNAIEAIDRKRLGDYEKIRAELLKLGRTLAAPLPATKRNGSAAVRDVPAEKPAVDDKGLHSYTVKKGDTLSGIISAYRRKTNLKVTKEQIRQANPGVDLEKLRPRMKILIPGPNL
jgi:LysM repeat protein